MKLSTWKQSIPNGHGQVGRDGSRLVCPPTCLWSTGPLPPNFSPNLVSPVTRVRPLSRLPSPPRHVPPLRTLPPSSSRVPSREPPLPPGLILPFWSLTSTTPPRRRFLKTPVPTPRGIPTPPVFTFPGLRSRCHGSGNRTHHPLSTESLSRFRKPPAPTHPRSHCFPFPSGPGSADGPKQVTREHTRGVRDTDLAWGDSECSRGVKGPDGLWTGGEDEYPGFP